MVRVLGIGDNTVDIYVDHGIQFPGGNAVNVAVLARRLGAEASYLGCVGDDHFGNMIKDALIAENVDISHLRTLNAPNAWSRIRHAGADRVFDGSQPTLRDAYQLTDDDHEYIARHDMVHSSIYSKIEADLQGLRNSAPRLSFDYSDEFDWSYIGETAPMLDIAFLSDADSGETGCRALCKDVAALGPTTVVITRGSKGAIGFRNGEYEVQPVIHGTIVDTLGAGDGFIAGFLLTLHGGQPLAQALARGAENALSVCAYRGAFGYGTAIQPNQPGIAAPEQS